MNDGPVQFAKRELLRQFSTPRVWVALVAGALVVGLVGPFGTFDALPLLPRLGYWLAIGIVTYAVGHGTVYLLVRVARRRGMPGAPGFALAGALAGLPVAAIVIGFNAALFGNVGPTVDALLLIVYCVVIAAAVSVMVALFSMPAAGIAETSPAVPEPPAPTRPALLDRLPVGRRGALSHLSMQDHYVEVHTDKGSALVLMRLADAIAETAGVDGLRVHRSHWVAKDAVTGTTRRDGRLFLRLGGGAELPVSRGYLAGVREAGLGR
ncbi:MAG: LytTR family DNA-binding domain-containing protein [Rhizobiaceae bacterium]